MTFWNRHGRQLIDSIAASHEDLMSFSLVNCYNILAKIQSVPATALFNDILWQGFFVNLLISLRTLVRLVYLSFFGLLIEPCVTRLDQSTLIYTITTSANFTS